MKKYYDGLIKYFGWFGIIRLLLYPITAIIINPIQLVRSLWSSRILLKGDYGKYQHFNPFVAINCLFYNSRLLDFKRFGRNGKSKYTGLGNYFTGNFFHYTILSLKLFSNARCIMLFICMFGWLFSHFLWLSHSSPHWVISIIIIAGSSTTFYSQLFGYQNYNALGWLFFPLAIYGLIINNVYIATIALFLCSFGSFTSIVVATMLFTAYALFSWSFLPIIAIIPAGIKLLFHLKSLIEVGNLKKVFSSISKLLGITTSEVKYKRELRKIKLNIFELYSLILYLQFLGTCIYIDKFPFLFLVGILIYLINLKLFRFADAQSITIVLFSIATAYIIQYQSLYLLISYLFLIFPIPFSNQIFGQFCLDIYPIQKPFDINPIKNAMEKFLLPINSDEKLLMIFKNPNNRYNALFDGYRVNIELINYVCHLKKILFLPTWWVIAELNYPSAPDFWAQEPDEVIAKKNEWNADYIIIIQPENLIKIDPKWENAGFVVLNNFYWSSFSESLLKYFPKPNWWLLKYDS